MVRKIFVKDSEHWAIMLPNEYWLHEKVKINDHLHPA